MIIKKPIKIVFKYFSSEKLLKKLFKKLSRNNIEVFPFKRISAIGMSADILTNSKADEINKKKINI